MTFDSFGLPSVVMTNIKNLGYATPTPIQTRAIPAAMQGRDLMGLAQTGTGKTAAFLLPIITRLMKRPPAFRRKARALILAPTRELAEQIHESALDLAKNTGLRSTTVYGGVNMNRQITALRNGADIVVACPGRLLDHMGQRTVDLTGVEVLVLDEADQMFDMGFLPDIKKVLAGLPKERQTMLFSATMPEAIRTLATDILKEPETVSVGHSAPAETVSHAIYPVPHHLKTKLLLELIKRNGGEGSYLVFTRTKHRAKRLAENLEKLGHKAAALQGNLSQNRRKEAMDGFRSGRFRIMVATDIAARGIDVSLVSHVVNFDVPSTPETYTHRIGRTGRAERTGEAHTFVTAEDMSMVRAIERLMREPLTRKKLDGFDYNELPSVADKDFNRPIMDRRGGYGQRGQRPASGYRSEGRSEGRSENRGEARAERPRSQGASFKEGGQGRDGGSYRDGGAPREGGASRDNAPRQGGYRDGGYRDGGARREGGQAGLFGRKPKYGALRSENSDEAAAGGFGSQPGDDIYSADRRDERRGPRRDGRPGQGRGQGRQGRGERPAQGGQQAQRREDRPESRQDGEARAAKSQGYSQRPPRHDDRPRQGGQPQAR